MREILFRGKRVENGKWVDGSLNVGGGYYEILRENGGDFQVDPATVGQYTGKKDCGGDRIFEGDICKTNDNFVYVISWCKEDSMFVISTDGLETNFGHFFGSELEVLGNIHDNPELLEE